MAAPSSRPSLAFGDFVAQLGDDGRTAEVGYPRTREIWRKGYSPEALQQLVASLFESREVRRVSARLHPENHELAGVFESCGFEFEGHTKNSYWLAGENSDDLIYGLTPDMWRAWVDRPLHRPDVVEFVLPDTLDFYTMIGIDHHRSQKRFVSPVVKTMALVAVPPFEQGGIVDLWPRAVMADGVPAGFMVMSKITEVHPEPWIWRFLIDRRHQGRGIGKQSVRLAMGQARAWGADTLKLSFIEGFGSPGPMYLSMGFELTGEYVDGETVAQIDLG